MYYYKIQSLDTRKFSTLSSSDKLDMSEYGGFGKTYVNYDREYLVLEDVTEEINSEIEQGKI